MSAHVLLNLLDELEKNIRYKALPSILSVFPNELNKFNNTGARMQGSIYHMTLKWYLLTNLALKRHDFAIRNATFYGRQHITFLRHNLHI